MSPPPHICDILIAERAPRLTASPLWPLARPALYGVLGYGAARAMADAVAPLGGRAAFDHVSALLKLQVEALNLARLPAEGRVMVVCNHPTGLADGIAVHDAIRRVRGDAIFFANADALRVSAGLGETIIPVEWVEAKRTREKTRATLEAARIAFEAERCVIMFPAGRLARMAPDGALTDPPWAATAASLARKYKAPVTPIHVAGPPSRLFHWFDRFSQELRDVTLFHEMLNKTGKRFQLSVGLPIGWEQLNLDAAIAAETLKAFTEQVLPTQPDAVFA